MFGIGWPTHRSSRSKGGLGWPHDDRSSIEPVVPGAPVDEDVAEVGREVEVKVEEGAEEVNVAEQNTADPGVDPPPPVMAGSPLAEPQMWSRPLEWGSTAPHATEVQPWGQVIHVPSRQAPPTRPGVSADDPLAQLGPSAEDHRSVPHVSRETSPSALDPRPRRPDAAPHNPLFAARLEPEHGPARTATVAVIEHVEVTDTPSVTVEQAGQIEQVEVDLAVSSVSVVINDDEAPDMVESITIVNLESRVERTSDHPGVVVGDDWRPPGAPLAPVMDPAQTAPAPQPTTGVSTGAVPPVSVDVQSARHLDPEQLTTQEVLDSLPTMDDSTPLAAEIAENTRRRISLSGSRFPHPPRTRVLTVANQKGGVGKTTTTVNVAAALAQSGLRVLVLDIDPQGNASTALGIDHHAEVPSLYDVVVEDMPLADVVQRCPDLPNLWCAPATIDLAGAEIELVSFVARETRLKNALTTYLHSRDEQGQDQIDYVLIDCPPSLSLLTVNAFVAAKEVLIPIQCEYYALEGLSQLLKHIDLIRKQLNPQLHVSTIMLTMYDGRTRLSAQVADEVRTHFPDQVVKTTVPRSVRISEAPSHGQTVMTYDPASSGALSYLEASRELAEQVLTWDSTKREEQL